MQALVGVAREERAGGIVWNAPSPRDGIGTPATATNPARRRTSLRTGHADCG